MLVLTRRINESIMIGDNVEVIIVEIEGNQVKIAIDAPKDIVILRKEVENSKMKSIFSTFFKNKKNRI